jgi:cell division protein FtsL
MYFDIREEMNTYIKYSLKDLQEYSIIEFVMYFITLVTSVIVSCLMVLWYTHKIVSLTENLADYLQKVQQRSTELAREKTKSEKMLYQILPKKFARDLVLEKPVFAQHFNDVTVYFSSICGLNEIETRSNPMEIVRVLTDLHRLVKYLDLKT